MPKEVRDKLCDEIWSLCEGVIGDLVLKHDASRVVQTLVKYCSKERRDAICLALKSNYYNLATSAYGKYLLIKLLHYGSKESRELILSELHGKLRKLMRHREGAYVVEDMYVLYATAKQKQQMIKEFWGSEYAFFRNADNEKTIVDVCNESTEKRKLIASNLQGTIKASVEKGSTGFQILHAAMGEYIQIFEGQEVRDFIEMLQDQVAELVHTPEGCDVACTIIAKATAKERKAILRGLKEHALTLVKNEYGQLVLQVIFMTVDDTVLVNKTFSHEFKEDINLIIANKFSRRPFIYLLNGLDKSYFSPLVLKDIHKYMEASKETSKKDQDVRRKEILKNYIPLFYDAINNDPYTILAENMGAQFALELLLNNDFPELVEEPRKKLLSSIIDAIKGDLEKEDHLLSNRFTPRLLKTLIQGGKWNNKEKKVVKVEGLEEFIGVPFAKQVAEELFDDGEDKDALKVWISNNQGAFVIVSLLDSLGKDSNFGKKVKKSGKFIKKQEESNKGAHLLTKVLSL
ncbi:unnamed protein product [Ambrosiozyma monospora]|uniref:Unnamed protein product n=1 Tax=Ambrosiozyma monospora TaxID=43982 RepID=A0ACB5SYI8_AMBMO|nr:unnamed protein product [Ambrosiozyma monospora]